MKKIPTALTVGIFCVSESRLTGVLREDVARDKDAQTICSELFRDYSHGLAIVARNTGAEEFSIPKEAVENPDKFLSEMVVNSFKK